MFVIGRRVGLVVQKMPMEVVHSPRGGQRLWRPSSSAVAQSQMSDFGRRIARRHGVVVERYEELWRWSVENIAAFWGAVWEYCDIIHSRSYDVVRSRWVGGGGGGD